MAYNPNEAVLLKHLVDLAGRAKNYIDTAVKGKEATTNKVTSITSSSTDTQYPSAKAVYDLVNGIPNGNEVSY